VTAVIGIDPGLHGAVARFTGTNLVVEDMPTLAGRVDGDALATLIAELGQVSTVCIEEVSTRPGQGAATTLTTGINYGIIVGVCAAMGRPVSHARPASWTAALSLPKAGKTAAEKRRAKEARVARCIELWPGQAHVFRGPKGGLLDGRADAALIAYHAFCRMDARGVA
jgi:hypothetical protein